MTSTALVYEILHGTADGVARALQAGADVNEIDAYGFTPLIETAIVDKVEPARLLIEKGADVNEPDLVGRTALHWASDNNNLPFCQLLLENHANPNAYSRAGQPILIFPLLREQLELKNLLYQFGADLHFAQDYINAKLIGHRYELIGCVDIINAKGHFIEINFEGFFLEFTLGIIQHSLQRYKNNFAARAIRHYFGYLKQIIDAFRVAAELIRYQHYLVNKEKFATRIDTLLQQPLLLIPVAYEGHAITFIRYKQWLIKCDRGAASNRDGTVVVYRIGNLLNFNAAFVKRLIYKKSNAHFIEHGIVQHLALKKVAELPLSAQITGNCSWANVEATVPAMLFLLLWEETEFNEETTEIAQCIETAMAFYQRWQEWDKDIALHDCVSSFSYEDSNPARNASKAAILGAILFQCCRYGVERDLDRAQKILDVLRQPQYQYVLQSYLKVYQRESRTAAGYNLKRLLEYFDVQIN